MQGYAWLYLIVYPIDYIIYAYNYIYGFSLFADALRLPVGRGFQCWQELGAGAASSQTSQKNCQMLISARKCS